MADDKEFRPACKGYEVDRDGVKKRLTRLHAGCGRTLYHDCVNVDISAHVGADVVADLRELPFEDDTFDSVYMAHTLEHIAKPLPVMQELHRVCAHGAVALIRVPYGSSDNAWEDPTHARPYFLDSWGYFSQAAYGGADYGYRGDWTIIDRQLLILAGHGYETLKDNLEELLALVMTTRNVVEEMKAVLRCVKPARNPTEAREASPITFKFHRPPASNDSAGPSIVVPEGSKLQ